MSKAFPDENAEVIEELFKCGKNWEEAPGICGTEGFFLFYYNKTKINTILKL